jgi:carbonic anhydrase
VVGHTNCGGAAACYSAALAGSSTTPVDPLSRWLAPLTSLASSLGLASESKELALTKLVEENVRKQVENIVSTTIIRDAWTNGKKIHVHGLVYDLATGSLKDLNVSQGPP